MKLRLIAAIAISLCLGEAASAHRLDEYLQATLISVEKDHVQASMRLIPGVAVSSSVIASMDSNSDGILSNAEQQVYATRVLSELSLTVDGMAIKPKLLSAEFPPIEQMKAGLGEIHIEFAAALPPGGRNRRLILQNHPQTSSAVYLINCLVPTDQDIRIVSQTRNEQQSFYQLDYVQAGVASASLPWWPSIRSHIESSITTANFVSFFRLGMRHIAEGTDHLLFLLALLLPAPLIVSGSRWSGFASARSSLLHILKVVTAFTVGHSITLALAAFGFVHVPSRPIEVMIAVSILVSAIHALRPIFPGKETAIAAFFGLIHGVAFAATLDQLGLGRWQRVTGVLAFNLGIETMQMGVVAVTIPSLILMSRTRAYPYLRNGGALFAGVAAIGWIAERLLGLPVPVDAVVNNIAWHATWIAGALFLLSLGCWLHNAFHRQPTSTQRPAEA